MRKYRVGERFNYAKSSDYGVLPDGTVIFPNKDLPDDIKIRLIEDVKSEMEEFLHPTEDKT